MCLKNYGIGLELWSNNASGWAKAQCLRVISEDVTLVKAKEKMLGYKIKKFANLPVYQCLVFYREM
jgi:hypothetical protein